MSVIFLPYTYLHITQYDEETITDYMNTIPSLNNLLMIVYDLLNALHVRLSASST